MQSSMLFAGVLLHTNAEIDKTKNEEYNKNPGQCRILEGLHFLQVLTCAFLASYRNSRVQSETFDPHLSCAHD